MELILKEYFNALSSVNFEKAKQIWNTSTKFRIEDKIIHEILKSYFVSYVSMDRKYYSMKFISKRLSIFKRKEKRVEFYSDLKDCAEALLTDKRVKSESVVDVKVAVECLVRSCDLRLRLTEMYQTIFTLSGDQRISVSDIINIIQPVSCYFYDILNKNDIVCLIQEDYFKTIELELNIMMNLAEAHERIANLYFLVPINLLHSVDRKCRQFNQLTSGTNISGSSRIFSRTIQSTLGNWFQALYLFSLAKYTLYFYPVLMKYACQVIPDSDSEFDSDAFELVRNISVFVKRCSVSSVILVFDAAMQNEPFLGHGYVLPNSYGEPLSGLQSYPVVFSWPKNAEVTNKLLCAIVMLISRLMKGFNSEKTIEYFSEPLSEKTYFLARIEKRFYFTLYFRERREKEKSIINFIEDFRKLVTGRTILEKLAGVN